MWAPQLYDILASTVEEQKAQLGSYTPGKGYAVLRPVEVR
jgi:carbohydrate-binding DOMON domain-containing protein